MQVYVMKLITGTIGSAGFAILFGLRGKKMVLATCGGALSLGICLFCQMNGMGPAASLFFGSFAGSVMGEVLARVVKAPVLSFLVPMLIPLVPGSSLYNTMYALINDRYEEFGPNSSLVLEKGAAIAMGLITASYGAHLLMRIYHQLMVSKGKTPPHPH